jgi:hypothetical protein
MKTLIRIRVLGSCALVLATPAFAGLIGVDLGTAAPPAVLGGYYMQAFPADPSPEFTIVFTVTPPAAAPVSGPLFFDTEMIHNKVGGGWLTWSHGYEGSVYHFDELMLGEWDAQDNPIPTPVVLSLPGETKAFSFYLEPAFFGSNQDGSANFEIAVETTGGLAGVWNEDILGFGGAAGFGFYTDDPLDSLASISILGLDTWPDGWAVGEFAINSIQTHGVPDGGTSWVLLGLAVAGLAFIRKPIQ